MGVIVLSFVADVTGSVDPLASAPGFAREEPKVWNLPRTRQCRRGFVMHHEETYMAVS